MGLLKKRLNIYKTKKLFKLLINGNPEKIQKYGENLVLPAFKKAYSEIPAFKKIYNNLNIDNIHTFQDYKRSIQIIEKDDVFTKYKLKDLCRNSKIDDMRLAMTSSGFSGIFSYGIITKENEEVLTYNIDTVLNHIFNIFSVNTFLINALPMGVKANTSLPTANTSVRPDMVFSMVDKFKEEFEQILIVSDPHFIKYIIEHGLEKNFNWEAINVKFICGEDWMSESLRGYFLKILGCKYNKNKVVVGQTMGLTELDLNLLHESPELIFIRKEILDNEKLRVALFGDKFRFTPTLLHYYPHRCFIEVKDNKEIGELVYSMLSPSLIAPVFRYNSKDTGKIFSYEEFCKILDHFGLSDLRPRLKLPICAIFGRERRFVSYKNYKVHVEDIREAIFLDHDVAKSITGMFRLNQLKNNILLDIQLKENLKVNKNIVKKINAVIKKYLGFLPKIKVWEYSKFPYQMKLDYETKFKCI